MTRFTFHFRLLAVAATFVVFSDVSFAQQADGPRVFLLDIVAIDVKKQPELKPAIDRVDREARKAVKAEVLSIVTKTAPPPSGDKHDYMSQAPYFWRNPNTPTGFPYIRRDGERNPEIKQYSDHDLLDNMIDTVERLSIGYFVTGKDEYAFRAGEILRMWFLDPKTKMNPNLEFAQAIPGLNTGRGIGIIETRGLTRVVDSVGLLARSPSWTKADQAGVEAWLGKYVTWLTESKNGRDESAAKNNHGTFYDVQLASFALFSGNRDLAKKILESAKQKRIAVQIEPDGRQPLELERTKSWDYCVMNLEGMLSLARLGDRVGIDLWSFQTSDGRSIRKAVSYLAAFTPDVKKWSHKQITPIQPERMFAAVRRAGRRYKDAEFQKLVASLPKLADDVRARLVDR